MAFLLRGGVFDEGLLDAWIALKRGEVGRVDGRAHPMEYTLYFEG